MRDWVVNLSSATGLLVTLSVLTIRKVVLCVTMVSGLDMSMLVSAPADTGVTRWGVGVGAEDK